MPASLSHLATQWRAPGVMVFSGLSLYAGAAVAVGLFEQFPPLVVAWFRVSAAGVLLALIARPRLRHFRGRAGAQAAVYGLATMGMNMAFYQAINSVALGTAVAVEFLGPVLVAAWGSRYLRDWLALALAAAGVVVISGATWHDSSDGIGWALLAGGLWAVYIMAGSRVAIAQDGASPRTTMAVGFIYAGLAGLPCVAFAWPQEVGMGPGHLIALAVALGLLSAAIPYSLDQVVLRMAGPSYFAVVQAVLPLVAALVGAVALRQWLSGGEVVGIVLVIAALALRKP
ncbi:EamA family transporter [Corynebacterium lizhenjunii]|nr:EamA family transporter [Corynebacterium lizhenjunii]